MHWINRIPHLKIVLVSVAVLIAFVFLKISQDLVRTLSYQERANMSIWAEAMRSFNQADEHTDLSLVLQVINSNHTIPIVVLDSHERLQSCRNLHFSGTVSRQDSILQATRLALQWKREGKTIRIDLGQEGAIRPDFIEICYDDSILLKKLSSYPYVELAVVCGFILIVVFALLSSKKAEQNKVWVGLSKETAHQLGTPISSLMAWVEILKENYPDDELIPEMNKDIKRLEVIADRFSKVGSIPELHTEDLRDILAHVVRYISVRVSSKIKISLQVPYHPLNVQISASLFEWVVENLCKNAADAISGEGCITIQAMEDDNIYVIDVTDTGKGIAKKNFKTVFKPGYTTKKRGWGLGLSLAKRIVEEYHKGRIYVRKSEPGIGTTFRVELKKH